ncbi:hypothetical protein GCM10007390_51340 [Persicitalea jodogahamensis]|uniref:Curli production assembly/transport component CsgG n=2 Tax=Persicitalea jodogahamensis TaxID=402147 RepID=A0A8J3GBA1_9BACT|nr:hypothetical protein GCM10007390_51340 [Persicitalea jodogahamensis]
MDEKIKTLATEIADQAVKNGCKKVAVTSLEYKGCNTEFGKFMAEELTGNLSVSGRNLVVVNQKFLDNLLEQNKLTVKGLLEEKNEAAKLGQASGIDGLIYGTITTLGEEIRVSVNIVKLPTLAVLGYTKGAFSLTNGIKEMLTCIEMVAQSGQNTNQVNTSNSNVNTPKPATDCATKSICVVCATNKTNTNIKVKPGRYGLKDLYLHPNETKCWEDFSVGNNVDYADVWVDFQNDANQRLKLDEFVIEPCKTYMRTLTK